MELALEFGQDLDDGLGGPSGSWDDVAHGGSARSDVFGAEPIEHLLGSRASVYSGHHSSLDAKSPLEDQRDWREAVGLDVSTRLDTPHTTAR